MSRRITIGIFVGGKGTRMGGVAKGLLRVPDGSETLVERLVRQCARAAPESALFLVGQSTPYAALSMPQLADAPAGVGPIGGLRALLLRACADQSELALALACDLPFLDDGVVSSLLLPLSGSARVPFVEGRLQPLAAAYAPAATLSAVDHSLALGKHALMHVLEQLGSELERVEFDAERARALRDWDTPEDVQR
ncbi:MAG: NTP transferase domain-containing protein [Pseudomonadota bacterium]